MNSATSLFFISLSETERNNTGYCTFATLDEDDVEELKDLQEEIFEYIADEANVISVTKTVDADDPYVASYAKKEVR